MSARTVIVVGGGVAGLTVAHELLDRGFDVSVLERRALAGGKARSFRRRPQTHGGGELRFQAPVEHGFHFFPGFYKNLDDTLKRIPVGGGRMVYDLLRPAPEELFGFIGRPEITVRSMAPATVAEFQSIIGFPDRIRSGGLLAREDLEIFTQKIWQIATSCRARREIEYEAVGWRSFVGSLDRSEQYYWYLANGLTRALVAAQGGKASTKTIGDVGLRILGQLARFNGKTDRVLAGPANDVWFDPWIRDLERRFPETFRIHVGAAVRAFRCEGQRVAAVELEDGSTKRADLFISALPVEGLNPLLGDLVSLDPSLLNVRTLAGGAHSDSGLAPGQSAVDGSKYLRWMSGIQFFLREPLDINAGHQMLLDTPWGLTSISQRQFWEPEFNRELDDAGVGALLSVEISSWDAPGLRTRLKAAECPTREAIAAETWSQLEAALPGQSLPRFADVLGWFLDDSVTDPNGPRPNPDSDGKGLERVNLEPVVVNTAGAREIRPGARTRLENFFLAGDYVRTETDLACMESANESGKRAANAVLDATGVRADECAIIKPQDPFWTAPLRWMDESRFERNLPWSGWEMGKWIVRGLEVAKWVTDTVFGEGPNGASPGRMIAAPPSAGNAVRGDLPDRNDWDPRLAELREEVSRLRGSEPDCANLLDAEQALSSAELRARLERLRDRLAPPGTLLTVNNRSDSLFARWRFFDSRHLYFFDPKRDSKRERNDYREDGLEVPVPFQIYDADALVIQGSADIGYLEEQLAGTGLVPVRDQNGLGFIEVWIMDYPDACVGPHREAAIHVVAAPASTAPEDLIYERRDGFGCELPILNAETKLFTLNILLSEMSAIAYGEQLFGIAKDYVDARMERKGNVRSFSFAERSRETGQILGEPFFWGRINERGGLAQKVLSLAALTQAVGAIEVVRDTWKAIEMDVFTATMVGPTLPGFSKACNGFVEILADYKLNSMLTQVGDDDKIGWATHHKFGRHLEGMCFKPLLFTRDRHLKSVLYARDWIRHPKRLDALAYAGANEDVRPDWRAAADL